MTIFIKDTDKKNRTYIIEGEPKPNQVLSIKRFICEVQDQGSDEKTQELADFIIKKLSA